MRLAFLLFFSVALNLCSAQVVFLETFDEVDDAIIGVDNTAGLVSWTTTCPGSVAIDDYFKVLSGKLEAKDTNGPAATWETGDIDISACTGILITIDMEELSNMEECGDCVGSGITCIDWVKLEYNLDGAGWTEVAGTTCPLTESPGEMIQIGDIVGGGPITYASPCIDFGTTLAIRISCMSWAAAEIWRFDNITVSCYDCVLPVELAKFNVVEAAEGASISWSTMTERATDYFMIERSYDGINFEPIAELIAAGNSEHERFYEFLDRNVVPVGIVYYHLRQIDLDGKAIVSPSTTVEIWPPTAVVAQNGRLTLTTQNKDSKSYQLNIYGLSGQLIATFDLNPNESVAWNRSGIFVVEIPSLNFHQKLVIQ